MIPRRTKIHATEILLGATLGLSACSTGEESTPAWNPELGEDTGTTADPEATTEGEDPGDGDTTGGGPEPGEPCLPGEVAPCPCADGPGFRTCNDDGQGFGACECEDEGTTTGEPDGTTGEEPTEPEVCYLGVNRDYATCLPLYVFGSPPDGYDYPAPYMGNPNYRAPIALLDLEAIDPATMLAPNFRLDEIAQVAKGRYAVVQPHAIESLQALRDTVGAIGINSGYRSPAYNASLPGAATYSRHMYGDAYDMDPIEVGLPTLEAACTAEGGMLVEYDTHVHCDFRFDPVDEELYGAPLTDDPTTPPVFDAWLVQDADGRWSAPAEGFDEGRPQRRWTARDASGDVLASFVGERFAAPEGTARIEVRVGAQVERWTEVPGDLR